MTRSNALLQQIGGKITWTANKYRLICQRLVALSSTLQDDTWQEILWPLYDSDLVGLTLFDDSNEIGIDGDGPDDGVTGKRVLHRDGRKTLTWIWTVGTSRKKMGVDATKADPFAEETSTGE
jgi:hypothetical protein